MTEYLRLRDRLVALCAQRPRLTYDQIAVSLGIPRGSIGNYTTKAIQEGLVEPRYRTGANVPLTAQQKMWLTDMVSRRKAGQKLHEIGAHFGITKQAVQQFLKYHQAEI